MAAFVNTFTAARGGGDIFIRLEALKALPIEGVISAFTREVVNTEPDDEPSYTTFRIPPIERKYVLYGVITPLRRVWGSPKYERTITQPGNSYASTPVTIKTRKVSAGEYVGPPEIISIVIE